MIELLLAGLFASAFFAIFAGLLLLVRRLQRGAKAPVPREIDGGVAATVGSAVALVVLVVAAVVVVVPRPAEVPTLVVKLTGYQFGWKFEYVSPPATVIERAATDDAHPAREVSTTDHLVLPRGVVVTILATSSDVIHRLEIPELNVRKDLIPGLVSRFTIRAPRAGKSIIQSDGLCGASLNLMLAQMTVVEPEAFLAWLKDRQS